MEKVYVTYTCKKCGCAFIDLDPNDSVKEIPLKTRYCPDCVKNGFKNTPFKKEEDNTFNLLIKEHNITDKKDISFLRRKYNEAVKFKKEINQKIYPNFIFKDCLEILSYQNWKQNT